MPAGHSHTAGAARAGDDMGENCSPDLARLLSKGLPDRRRSVRAMSEPTNAAGSGAGTAGGDRSRIPGVVVVLSIQSQG
jgi:hypothetical protein